MAKIKYMPTRFTLVTLTIIVTAPTAWDDEKGEYVLQYWPPIKRKIENYAKAVVKSLDDDVQVKVED